MTALGGGHRGGQACRAGADHGHPLRGARGLEHQGRLPARPRIHQAGGPLLGERVVQAGLVAGDARVDPVLAALESLADPGGIGQEGPRHGHQIGLSLGQDRLRVLRHGDAVGRRDRHRDLGLQRGGRLREGSARDARDDRGHAGLVPADAGVEDVDACVLELMGQGDDVLPGLGAVDQVHQGDPVDDRQPRGRGAHRADDLHREATTALGVAAPVVLALIRALGQELVEQVALRAHDLDGVVAGLLGEHGAAGEVLDRGPDLLVGQLSGGERADGGLRGRGGDRLRVIGVAPRVQDLQGQQAAGLVDGVGEDPVMGRLGGIRELAAPGGEAAFAVGAEAAGDHQAGSAAGALGEVRGELGELLGIVLHTCVHGAHEDAVGKLQPPDAQGGGEAGVLGHAAPGCDDSQQVDAVGYVICAIIVTKRQQ